MGIFYTDITLKDIDQQSAASYLKANHRQAYVSPTFNGCTVVFDKASDEDGHTLYQLAAELSEALHCVALAVLVHDGDLFLYWLYERGRLADEYNSAPGYFEVDVKYIPTAGNAEKLCEAFQVPEALVEVHDIFQRVIKTATDDDYSEEHLIGDEIHDVLAQALNLPLFVVDTGYYSIVDNILPADLEKAALIYCGEG